MYIKGLYYVHCMLTFTHTLPSHTKFAKSLSIHVHFFQSKYTSSYDHVHCINLNFQCMSFTCTLYSLICSLYVIYMYIVFTLMFIVCLSHVHCFYNDIHCKFYTPALYYSYSKPSHNSFVPSLT